MSHPRSEGYLAGVRDGKGRGCDPETPLKTIPILCRRQMENLIEGCVVGATAVEARQGGYGVYREFVFLLQQCYGVLHTETVEVAAEVIVGLLLARER